MRRNVKTISPDATVAELVVALADTHVSGFPVIDDRGRMIGVVSATDVIGAEAEAEDEGPWSLESMLVRDIMTPRPLTVGPDTEVEEAARQMMYADVHRLFVVVDNELVGVVSTSDVARALATRRL
jgi:CBS domain-containing protein